LYIGFWLEKLRERDHLEDPGIDGSIIFRWIFRKWEVRECTMIELDQDKNRCPAVVNAVIL